MDPPSLMLEKLTNRDGRKARIGCLAGQRPLALQDVEDTLIETELASLHEEQNRGGRDGLGEAGEQITLL